MPEEHLPLPAPYYRRIAKTRESLKKTLERYAVDQMNKARAAHSDRYLYAHIHHTYVEKLAAEFKDSRPRMRIDGFGPEKFAQVKISRRSKPRS